MAEGNNLVGVDIGTSAIKVCEIRERKKQRELVRFGVHPLPPQAIVDGHVMDAGAVVEGLEKLFHKASRRDVALRLGGHSVIIKKVVMPLMSTSELAEQIPWEAEQHVPFDVSDVELDYQVLQRREGQGQMDVLLVAAKREEVADLTNIAMQARLRPKVVDLDAFAMQNCFEAAYGEVDAMQTVALINVGAAMTTLNVLSEGTTAFTRDITNGGNTITEEIQRRLGISVEEAETHKCGGAGTGIVPPEVPEIINTVSESLAGEIQRSIDFFLATSGNREVHRVYVAGGTSNARPLLDAIERRCRVPVEQMDAFRGTEIDAKSVDPLALDGRAGQAVVAMGLALRKDRERSA